MIYVLWLIVQIVSAELHTQQQYLRWTDSLSYLDHPESGYQFYAEHHKRIAAIIQSTGHTVTVDRIGKTHQNRSIWSFRIRPNKSKHNSVFVLGGIHPIEWVSPEAAVSLLLQLAQHPPEHTEVLIVPFLNIDRRLVVEQDLLNEEPKYRRVNSGGEDLNRDYEIHREATAIWRHLFPERYTTSTSPLSQPESQAIDNLFVKENFNAAVSVHAFGGYIYYPWAGRYPPVDNWEMFHHLGTVMKSAQSGKHPYHVKQLSHWLFLFRAQGTELDHFYGKYGTRAFLIESTRSGIQWWRREDWSNPFRLYNPRDPTLDIQRTVESMWALIRHYDRYLITDETECPCQSQK